VKQSITQSAMQHAFDFDALNEQPVENIVLNVASVIPQNTQKTSQEKQVRSDFYCYRLIRNDLNVPFYVGKGVKARIEAHEMNARNHEKDCNHRVCNTIRKLWREGHRVIREKIAEGITEASAFALEQFYVSLGMVYGWPLCNHTNGGEGVSGYRWTEEQRKMRQEVVRREMELHPDRHARFQEARANKVFSAEEIQRRNESVARAWSDPELKKAQSERVRQQWQDEDIRAKRMAGMEDPGIRKRMGDHFRGKTNPGTAKTYSGFIGPDDTIYENVTNLCQFSRDQDIALGSLRLVASGKQYEHKGWRRFPLEERPEKKIAGPRNVYTGFVSPHDGQVYTITTTLKDFCQEHGLSPDCMYNVNVGIQSIHKGWTKYQP
jgi:hypothetical protein